MRDFHVLPDTGTEFVSAFRRRAPRPRSALKRLLSLLVPLCLVFCPSSPAVAKGERSRAADEAPARLHLVLKLAVVSYGPGDAGLARLAGLAVQDAAQRITKELGIAFSERVSVALVRGREEFLAQCGGRMPEWAMAAALPRKRRIVVDAARVTPATANDMRLVVAHEMVHLALGQLEKGRKDRIPRWFHEGVAVWLSGQMPVRGSRGAFRSAAAQGALIPFDHLERRFPKDPYAADLAYVQSEAFIAHIAGARSPEALRWVLARYRNGQSFDKAFEGALGISRPDMEARWAKGLRKRFPWIRVLWETVPLFGLVALLALLAFVLVRRRARRQHRIWDEEERMWTVAVAGDDEDEDDDEGPDDPDEDDPYGLFP